MKRIYYTITTDGAPFRWGQVSVWISPYSVDNKGIYAKSEPWLEAFENDNQEGAILAPFGDSYWDTLTEAYEFVMQVKLQYERFDTPTGIGWNDPQQRLFVTPTNQPERSTP